MSLFFFPKLFVRQGNKRTKIPGPGTVFYSFGSRIIIRVGLLEMFKVSVARYDVSQPQVRRPPVAQ